MTADRNRNAPDHSVGHPAPVAQSIVDRQGPARVLGRAGVIDEVITLAVCGPSAPVVMVMVAVHGWPPWWLVVAGMLVAWTGDALWTLGEHTAGAVLARRTAKVTGSRGESRARHDAGHTRLREQTRAAGDHR